MDLFIDTNVFLSFFHFSSEDLEELRKIRVLVRNGTVRLILPAQVDSEFRRNRDGTVADALKRLREQKLTFQFPQLCKGYDEYDTFRGALGAATDARSELLERLERDVTGRTLKADLVVRELFDVAHRVAETSEQLQRARDRAARGDPPGKKGTLGDALNWESLLDTVDDGQDLYFVSGDGDWISPLDDDQFDSYLNDEWGQNKHSSIVFYRRLSVFFRDHFPTINLATEEEKERLIAALERSGSFARSRGTLRQLAGLADFTPVQLNAIANAATVNNQIYWIITDADISTYIRGILSAHVGELDQTIVAELERLLGRPLVDG